MCGHLVVHVYVRVVTFDGFLQRFARFGVEVGVLLVEGL
jgi:hypothetical protein